MALFAKKSFVGLDLGHAQLKAVQMERSGTSWKVARIGFAPTPRDCVKDGVVVDIQALGIAIKQMLKDARINASVAHIAAAGASVFVRPVIFPKMTEQTLRKSIRFEASRYVPGSVDDSHIEFEVLGPVNETQMNVLIVSVPKDIVDSRVQACVVAGLEVESVDVEAFAMYRSLVEADREMAPEETTLALVDIGAESTSVSIVHQGIFAMMRSIPHGGSTLTDALKSYFKLSPEDAESGKSQLDIGELLKDSGHVENPPLRILQPHIDDLIREVRRSLNYFQSQNPEEGATRQVKRVFLAGGGAKLKGLDKYMEERLTVPVTATGIFDNPRFVTVAGIEGQGLDLAVASGLAMREYAKAA